MYQIKTFDTIATQGLKKFPRELYRIDTNIENPDAIVLRSHQLHDNDIPLSVKVIGRAGIGVNTIPVANLTKRGIPVLNTPGANANAVCEMVMAGLFLASRNICLAWDYVKHLSGGDQDIERHVEKQKKQFSGFEITGKTLGVIGLGSVGTKVANTAIALGMNVVGYDPAITVMRAWELSSNVKKAHTIDDVFYQSDFISFHVPLTNETKSMIGKKQLAALKKNSILLNFSREGIINNADLLVALDEKHIHTYVTDFPTKQFINHPAVICLPHLGASTKEAEQNCAVMIVEQVRNFLEAGAITHSVNFPNVEVPNKFNGARLAIANANVPNMVAQISEKLGHAGHNITSLVNKSRENIAYTVIDTEKDINEKNLTDIRQIDGVLQLRKLTPA